MASKREVLNLCKTIPEGKGYDMHEADVAVVLTYRQTSSAEGEWAGWNFLSTKKTCEAGKLAAATYGNVGIEHRNDEGIPSSAYEQTCPERLGVTLQEINDMVNEFQRHAIGQEG